MDNLFSEDWAIVGVIDPDVSTTSPVLTAAIDMADYEQLAGVLILGDRVVGAAIDFEFQSSATSDGSYAAISGKAISQITDTSPLSDASNKQYVVHLRGSEVTDNNRYVKASLQMGSPTAGHDVCAIVFGKARHRPAYDSDASSVSEIVN